MSQTTCKFPSLRLHTFSKPFHKVPCLVTFVLFERSLAFYFFIFFSVTFLCFLSFSLTHLIPLYWRKKNLLPWLKIKQQKKKSQKPSNIKKQYAFSLFVEEILCHFLQLSSRKAYSCCSGILFRMQFYTNLMFIVKIRTIPFSFILFFVSVLFPPGTVTGNIRRGFLSWSFCCLFFICFFKNIDSLLRIYCPDIYELLRTSFITFIQETERMSTACSANCLQAIQPGTNLANWHLGCTREILMTGIQRYMLSKICPDTIKIRKTRNFKKIKLVCLFGCLRTKYKDDRNAYTKSEQPVK